MRIIRVDRDTKEETVVESGLSEEQALSEALRYAKQECSLLPSNLAVSASLEPSKRRWNFHVVLGIYEITTFRCEEDTRITPEIIRKVAIECIQQALASGLTQEKISNHCLLLPEWGEETNKCATLMQIMKEVDSLTKAMRKATETTIE